MRFVFVVLAAAVAAVARVDHPELNPPAPLPAAPITNAKRFALGMPPLKPRTRRHGTRVGSAPRAQTSPTPPIQVECNIHGTFIDGSDFGYLAPIWSTNHTYYSFQPSQEGSLRVAFSYQEDDYRQLSLTTNGPQNQRYPYLGAVIAPESFDANLGRPTNYGYLAGTTDTPPGSVAVQGPNSFDNSQPMETAIWVYGAIDQALIPQWVNSADSGYSVTPTTHIVYIPGETDEEDRLVVTGDPLAIMTAYPGAGIIRLKCVPPIVAPV